MDWGEFGFGRGERRGGLFVVGGEVFADFGGEGVGEFSKFLGADAGDAAEFDGRRGIFAGHVAQGGVGEDDVRRNGAFFGDFAAEGAELFEERFVALDFAGAFGGFFEFGLLSEENFAAIFQRGAAFVGEFDDVHARGVLKQETEADEFAADGFPLFGRDVFADSVSGEFVVAVFQDSGGA